VTTESHPAPSPRDKTFLAWCAAAFGITFLLQVWLCRALIKGYFPTGDELALEVTSAGLDGKVNPATWFTEGFHYYFQSYREWQVAQTDFWRPLANALFWLHHGLFGTAWGSQLVFGYLAHAMMVGVTGYVAYRVFRLNRWLALLAMLIAALNPAFWGINDAYNSFTYNSPPELLQYPIFQTEILCALLMMAAFLAFIANRFALFCLFATTALLLKETALTVPLAAIALAGSWWRADLGRTLKNLAWLALPLAIWYAGRTLVFDFGKSVYVLSSSTHWGWLLKPIRNLLYLPSTLYRGPLAVTRSALLTHDSRTLLIHGFELAVNVAWWLAVLYALWLAWTRSGRRWFSSAPEPWISGLVFALGNIGLVMLLQSPDPRFTYFWFALGPAVIFAALAHKPHAMTWATALGLGLALPQVFAVERALSADSIRNYDLSKRSGRVLTQLLGTMPASVNTVYLIDDLVAQGTAPEYLARFAGYRGKLIVINSVTPILGCRSHPQTATRYELVRTAAGTQLDYRAPDCFYALNEAPIDLFDTQKDVKRGPWMTYHFPLMSVPAVSTGAQGANDYDPGNHWSVMVTDPACAAQGACIWLGLDPARQVYYALN